jgi:transcriptional regulator with XRE-family HTH domain
MSDEKSEVRVADWLADEWEDLQEKPTYVAEKLILDVTLQIAEAMEEAGFDTQGEFADHLGISKSAVSQLMSGDQNISLKRLVALALSLGKSVEVDLVDHDPPNVEAMSTKRKRVEVDGSANTQSDPRVDLWTHGAHGEMESTSSQPDVLCVNGKPVPIGASGEDQVV